MWKIPLDALAREITEELGYEAVASELTTTTSL
jgi:8-oxo-dGTP pyrophosphatase MutT (NUDIX family)